MSGDSGEKVTIRPLTKRTAKGDLYKRRPEVEEQLRETVGLDPGILAERVAIPNSDSDRYLYDETLVYLIREACAREDQQTMSLIYDELAVRVEALLKKLQGKIDEGSREDFCQTVHVRIMEKMFDRRTDAADFAEVMFGKFVTSEGSTLIRSFYKDRDRGHREDPIESPDEHGHGLQVESALLSPEDEAVLANALNLLPPDVAAAFRIYFIEGFQIESKDPAEPTVAKCFDVSGRTIRNWFRDAVKMLDESGEGLK